MSGTIYKILLLMKRRPGMSVAAFRDHYERRHAPLAARHASGMIRYVRRYLDPQPHPETGPAAELPFDVITELCFEDEAVFEQTLAALTTGAVPDEIAADEEKLFDRSSSRIATVLERESELPDG